MWCVLCKDGVFVCALLVKAALPLQGVRVKQQKLSSEASSLTSEVGQAGRSPINTTKDGNTR